MAMVVQWVQILIASSGSFSCVYWGAPLPPWQCHDSLSVCRCTQGVQKCLDLLKKCSNLLKIILSVWVFCLHSNVFFFFFFFFDTANNFYKETNYNFVNRSSCEMYGFFFTSCFLKKREKCIILPIQFSLDDSDSATLPFNLQPLF